MAKIGVDLTHPRWIHVKPGSSAKGSASEWPSNFVHDLGSSVLVEAERHLKLTDPVRSTTSQTGTPPLQDLQDRVQDILKAQRIEIERKVLAHGADVRIALALPYGTPWLVRSHLHCLLPPTVKLRMRVAVEAPIALALEFDRMTSTGAPQARGLYLTRADPGFEISALVLGRSDPRPLVVKVTSFASLRDDDFTAALKRFDAGGPNVPLIHPGLGDQAQQIEKALGGKRDLIDLGENAVACGAVRYIDLLGEDLRTKKIEVKHVATFALGILGTNTQGEWFWRRISDAGSSPTDDPERVVARANLVPGLTSPDRINVIECPCEAMASLRWLARKDWDAADLRWHQVVMADHWPDPWDLRVRFDTDRSVWKNALNYLTCEVVPSEKTPAETEPAAGQSVSNLSSY